MHSCQESSIPSPLLLVELVMFSGALRLTWTPVVRPRDWLGSRGTGIESTREIIQFHPEPEPEEEDWPESLRARSEKGVVRSGIGKGTVCVALGEESKWDSQSGREIPKGPSREPP